MCGMCLYFNSAARTEGKKNGSDCVTHSDIKLREHGRPACGGTGTTTTLQAGAEQTPEVQVGLFYAQVEDFLHVLS